MGAILISVPDFSDAELVFNEDETRKILKFFWPGSGGSIEAMDIDNGARRLAQTALVAAIDGSYAMGYMKALLDSVVQPGSGIKSFGKKLARRFVRHWWKHAKQNDLEDVRVYESVRIAVASGLAARFRDSLNGLAVSRARLHWYAIV